MNYVEWKLLSKEKKRKEEKRRRDIEHGLNRHVHWGYYTQWSLPTLLLFAAIAISITVVCIVCMGNINDMFMDFI